MRSDHKRDRSDCEATLTDEQVAQVYFDLGHDEVLVNGRLMKAPRIDGAAVTDPKEGEQVG